MSKLFELTLFRTDHFTSFFGFSGPSPAFARQWFAKTISTIFRDFILRRPFHLILVSMNHLMLLHDNGLPKPFQLLSEILVRLNYLS